MASREDDMISFEGWDTTFREGMKAPMWVRAASVVGVRQVVDNVCAVYLASGKEIQANANADDFVKLLTD